MDPRDASSSHNQRQPPPHSPSSPMHGVIIPPPPFPYGHHFPNPNVFSTAPNTGFNSLTPFDSSLESAAHHQQQQQMQQQRNGSPAVVQLGVSAPSPAATDGTEQTRKRKDRPGEYSPSSERHNLGGSSSSAMVKVEPTDDGEQNGAGQGSAEGSSGKRRKGRPPGSRNKNKQLGGAGGSRFRVHTLVVPAGQNVVAKLDELSQGPRTICVLSANGTVKNVSLEQDAGVTVYLQGQFDIVTLQGCNFRLYRNVRLNNILKLTVVLARPDGGTMGGVVSRELIAASPIQMVIGSFIADENPSNRPPVPTPPPRTLRIGASPPPPAPRISIGETPPPIYSTLRDATSDSAVDYD